MIKGLLQNYGDTKSSPKSYNNHFGVPLSLSELSVGDKYGIFEVGMSKPGEINNLSKLIKPDIGIITNIGEAHIENFKNLKGIADAKGEIINNISKNGTIILNKDDKYFNHLKKKAKLKNLNIVSFGLNKKSEVFPINFTNKTNNLYRIRVKDQILSLKFKNLNIYNVLSSLALLKELNLNLNKVVNFLRNYQSGEGRGKVHNVKRYGKIFKLIDESYNANPLSVKTAINNFKKIKKQNFKKYLFLGDMLELGEKSDSFTKIYQKLLTILI